jgi:hypothetical protein
MPEQTIFLIAVLLFGLLTFAIIGLVLICKKRTWGTLSSKLGAFIFILIFLLVLMLSNIPTERITPFIGLIGSVVGFFYGNKSQDDNN